MSGNNIRIVSVAIVTRREAVLEDWHRIELVSDASVATRGTWRRRQSRGQGFGDNAGVGHGSAVTSVGATVRLVGSGLGAAAGPRSGAVTTAAAALTVQFRVVVSRFGR